MRWFRLYNEIIDDPKVAKMSPKVFKFFIFLMCFASEREQNGALPFSKKELSWRLRIPIKRINLYINELKELKIIEDNPVILFINWGKRQFASDSSKERVKKHRDSKCNVTVTPDVTHQNRTEQNRTDIKKKNVPPFEIIIAYLNNKSNKNFRHTSKDTQKFIKARWNEGYDLDDFRKVIDVKTAKWLIDPKYIDYIRPQTLFGTKFESYLNETGIQKTGKIYEPG